MINPNLALNCVCYENGYHTLEEKSLIEAMIWLDHKETTTTELFVLPSQKYNTYVRHIL